ncbi:MAG: type IV pilus biogenesis/stability protein PilW [Gammaproteobacteria bacterium]|nr:type IV pilus biogenesis/stability protein PilW [Gammaproteobacteria bacterium]
MRNTPIKIIITSLITLFLVACTTTSTVTANRKVSKPNLKEASDLNTQLAIGYIQREQYKPAKEKLEKAIDQNSDNVTAYKTLAYLYALLGLEEKANEKYEGALDLGPDDPDLLNSYGAFLCAHGKLDEAQVQFKKAYDDPFYESRYLAQSNAGSCYVKQGEYKKAEPLLRQSLRLQPNLPGSLISMAEVGVKTERHLMARAYIERYHAARPASAESLWIQIQAEKALDAYSHYLKYARQLINDFPDSDEAGWVEAESHNEQFR